MRIFIAVFCALALPAKALAQDAELPEPIQALLAAAAATAEPEPFEAAVRLIALTQPADAILAGAGAISSAHAETARRVLDLPQAEPVIDLGSTTEEAAPVAPSVNGWRAAPRQAIETLANAESELWSGEIRAGFRQDSGNSDQLDYSLALSLERDLAVWGFQGDIDYSYAESNGAVGRDKLTASTQLDREIGERWTVFIGAEYDQDALSGFDWTTLVDAGFGYGILTGTDLSWRVQAGPALRTLSPVNGDVRTEAAGEFSSDADWRLSDALLLTADTQVLLAGQSRFEQSFGLETSLGELWALRLAYRYRNEFEPEPGFERVDTRTDLSLVRSF